jgi:phosphoglucosamine mutase
VGDRYVLERMLADGIVLGGEQSGHVVLLEHATTGDGILTGLQLLSRVAATGRPLADLAAVMTRMPQVLLGVRVTDRAAAMAAPALVAAIADAERELGANGRVLVRPSGTEPVVRVMVEALDETTARAIAERLAATVDG